MNCSALKGPNIVTLPASGLLPPAAIAVDRGRRPAYGSRVMSEGQELSNGPVRVGQFRQPSGHLFLVGNFSQPQLFNETCQRL